MEDDSEYHIDVTLVGEPAGEEAVARIAVLEAVRAALRRHRVRAARIGIALVDDARMAELNARHCDHPGSTDVLAFDLRDDPGEGSADTNGMTLEGEIVISIETALREAARRGHGADAETALYAVHGTLHLIGYDDQCEPDAARMHVVEDEILSSVGLGRVFGAHSS